MLEYNSGVKNPVVANYEKGATGTSLFMSIGDIDKSIDVASKKQATGTANTMLKNTAYKAALEQLKARHKNGDLTDDEYIKKANSTMYNLRASVFARIERGTVKATWSKAVTEAQDMWFKNTQIDARTSDALLYQYAAEGGDPSATEKEMMEYVKSNIVEFTGLFTGSANSFGGFFFGVSDDASSGARMKDSQGVPLADDVYEDGVNNIVKQYNEENPNSKIAVSDIRVFTPFNGTAGTDQVTWDVSLLKDGNKIPLKSYNGDDMIKMSAWESKQSMVSSQGYNKRLSQLEKNQEFIKARNEALGISKEPLPSTEILDKNNAELGGAQYDGLNEDYFRVKRTSGKTTLELSSAIEGVSQSGLDSLVKAESDGKYDAVNKSSGAYGRYQFKPLVAYEFAKKLGYEGDKPTDENIMPDELAKFMSPNNQDDMFIALSNRNVSVLKKAGIPVTPLNFYIAHQQGATGAREILGKKQLSKDRYTKMVYNLGLKDADEKALIGLHKNKEMNDLVRKQWLDIYKKKMA